MNEVFSVEQYGLSSVKKIEVFRVKQYGLSSVKKNELGDAVIEKKIVIVRGWTDSEYEVGSARNSRINSTILQASTYIRDQNRGPRHAVLALKR